MGTNLLVFSDLALSDVAFSHHDYGDSSSHGKALVISWDIDGEAGQLRTSQMGNSFSEIRFADGSILGSVKAEHWGNVNDYLIGTPGNDWINGGNGADIHLINGGGGDDVLLGARLLHGSYGDDTYRISRDGSTYLVYGEKGALGSDEIVFTDLTLADVTFQISPVSAWASLGEKLKISWTRSDGTAAYLEVADKGLDIERYSFADGSTLGRILADQWGNANDYLIGTSGNDKIDGLNGVDSHLINGGAGNDILSGARLLHGSSGEDTYKISRDGSTHLIYGEKGYTHTDQIVFTDLSLADVSFEISPVSAWASLGEKLKINWIRSDGTAAYLEIADKAEDIEKFSFADGITFDAVTIADVVGTMHANQVHLVTSGTSANDLVFGSDNPDILSGLSGDDIIFVGGGSTSFQYAYGGTGDDTYYITQDSKRTFIGNSAESTTSGDADRVLFHDLAYEDVYFSNYDYGNATNGNSIRINWNGGASEVRIAHQGEYIESFEFADGLSAEAIVLASVAGTPNANNLHTNTFGTSASEFLVGTDGLDVLSGNAGDDILDVGAGNGTFQYAYGGHGDDTYLIGQDSGRTFIGNNGETDASGTADRIIFQDLAYEDVSFAYYDYGNATNGNSLRILWDNGSSELRLAHEGQFIESYEFADGVTLSNDDFLV